MTPRSPQLQGPARVAITGVSGDVGLGAIAGLRLGGGQCWLLGLDSNADCAGFHLCDAHETVRPVADRDYLPVLLDALKRHRIDLLVCGVDSEVAVLSGFRRTVEEEAGCLVLVGPSALVEQFTDKLGTARWLYARGLNPPQTWDASLASEVEEAREHLPLIVKPRHGNAAKGIEFLRTPEDRSVSLSSPRPDYCIQELIEGPEYTCGLLFDREHVLRDWICARRWLIGGRTMQAEVVSDPVLDSFIKQFASKISFEGPLNLQLCVDRKGQPRVFEINPRLSGSTSMRIAVGYNDPARMVDHWLYGKPIVRANVRYATVYRYLTELVIPARTEKHR